MSRKAEGHCILGCWKLCSLLTKVVQDIVKVKVQCTLVQALRLCTGLAAHRGNGVIALPCLDHSTRNGWGVSMTPRPLFTSGKNPVLIVQEAGWVPGPVWADTENLAPNGIRSPDRPTRSQEFALQLRKKQAKTSVRVRKTSVRLRKTSVTVQYTY
jgi:hypothetical protein